MAAAATFKIYFSGHNSVAIAHIHTKLGSQTKTNVIETEMSQSLLLQKSKMAASPHYENT